MEDMYTGLGIMFVLIGFGLFFYILFKGFKELDK